MSVHKHPEAIVLLTRPRAASERFAKSLVGMEVIISPLMEIVGTGADVAIAGAGGIILTSEAAVPFVPATPLPVFCVGPRTASAAQMAGLQAEAIGQDADSLVVGLLARAPKAPLVHIHGVHQRGDVAKRLTDAGLPTQEVVAYDQRDLPPDAAFHAAVSRAPLLVPLFSPRSSKLFALAARGLHPGARLFAMSAAAAAELPAALKARTTIIDAPNGPEMARALRLATLRGNSP